MRRSITTRQRSGCTKRTHPYTEHYRHLSGMWIRRRSAEVGPVALAWFSPDCKHFSKAKGAALVDRKIRGLAWIALRWAAKVRPRVIILENVEEFQTWGPVRKGKPVKKLAGTTFQKFIGQLRALGYSVEWRELVGSRLWCANYQTSAGADCPLRRTCDRLAGAHTRPARQCGSAQRKTAAMAQRCGDH